MMHRRRIFLRGCSWLLMPPFIVSFWVGYIAVVDVSWFYTPCFRIRASSKASFWVLVIIVIIPIWSVVLFVIEFKLVRVIVDLELYAHGEPFFDIEFGQLGLA